MRYIFSIWCVVWCSVLANAQNISVNFTDTLLCIGGNFKLPYTVNNPVFTTGNIFTAQLSDALGSFTAPVTIGTKTSIVSDTIDCTIPPSSIVGTAYRVRIVSGNPVETSTDNGKNLYLSNYPSPNALISTPLCQGDTLTLSVIPIPIDSFKWYGPNILGVSGNPVKKFSVFLSDSGNYIVRAYYKGCQANDTVHLVVKPNPANIFSAVNTPLCQDDTLWLKANSATATSYQWKGPGAFSAAVKDTFIHQVALSHSGKYYITAQLDGCKVNDSITVLVKQRPRPKISFNAPVCATTTLQLQTNETINGETYQWSNPGGLIGTTKNITIPNIQFTASGKYMVVAGYNGCFGTDTATVTVNALPAKPVASTNTPLCEEDSLHLYTTNIAAGIMYIWNGPNNFTDTAINAHIANVKVNANGKYFVTANQAGCTQSDSIDISIKPKPEKPIITSNSPVRPGDNLYLELKNHRPGWGYKWTGPKGFKSSAIHPGILNADTGYTGTYFVTVTYDGCFNSNQTLVQIDYSTDTGIILLYPSPNNGGFTVRVLLKKDQNADLRIVNSAGQEMYRNTVATKDKVLNTYVDARNRLSSGVYILHLWADDTKYAIPFVVDR